VADNPPSPNPSVTNIADIVAPRLHGAQAQREDFVSFFLTGLFADRRNQTMDVHTVHLPERQQRVLDRFVAACQEDARVVAAVLSGSYAQGTADAYSDLDFGLILADAAYDDFLAEREAFLRRLGNPIFLRCGEWSGVDYVFFILSDGTEGELALGRESHFTHMHKGPYKALLDKTGCLAGAVFSGHEPTEAEQLETLRGDIEWFWHDLLHHFLTPLLRGQLWSAYGALEDLRRICVNLARFRADFTARPEGYEKVEQALPIEQLAPLQITFCPMERNAMLQAVLIIVSFYQKLAPSLAQTHAISYPADLAQMLSERLEQLAHSPGN
jgi:predicted nucleotidyltransferase